MSQPRIVSIRQQIQPSPFNLKVVDVWPCHCNKMVFVMGANLVTTHLLNMLSCWGGPSKIMSESESHPGAEGWELSPKAYEVFDTFLATRL